MKKIISLFVMLFVVGVANATDKWEYVKYAIISDVANKQRQFSLVCPEGKRDFWSGKETKPPTGLVDIASGSLDLVRFGVVTKKDFSQSINVINALGEYGFEMSGYSVIQSNAVAGYETFWFKRKISK